MVDGRRFTKAQICSVIGAWSQPWAERVWRGNASFFEGNSNFKLHLGGILLIVNEIGFKHFVYKHVHLGKSINTCFGLVDRHYCLHLNFLSDYFHQLTMAMVNSHFHSIKSPYGLQQNWRLRVKLVRVWNMASIATPNDPFATQMVMIDEEGGRIEATVPKQHMNKFSHSLIEGQIYRITNFGILKNNGKFRAVVHEFKIIFNATTRLFPCQNVSILSPGFALLKSEAIKKTNGRSEYLLDFMGIVTAVSEEINLSKEGRETRMMLIDLVDEMLALFGDMIDVVAGYLGLPRCGLPVLIIQLAKVNLYRGEVGIQNVMNASKVYWNPDIAKAIEFKNGLAVHEIETDVDI